jgi:hypothetical protein
MPSILAVSQQELHRTGYRSGYLAANASMRLSTYVLTRYSSRHGRGPFFADLSGREAEPTPVLSFTPDLGRHRFGGAAFAERVTGFEPVYTALQAAA